MPCITLISDLGNVSTTVGILKGIVLQQVQDANIIDISHQIEPYNLNEAAYILTCTYMHFPPGSFHIILIDMFGSDATRLLLCQHNGANFLSTDNGFFQTFFTGEIPPVYQVYQCKTNENTADLVKHASDVINKLTSNGNQPISYPLFTSRFQSRTISHKIVNNAIECHVIYIDRFDNVVLNITKDIFTQLIGNQSFNIQIAGRTNLNEIHEHYFDVPENKLLCRFNNAGFLELAVNRGSARERLGLQGKTISQAYYNPIKIYISK